MNAQRAPAAVTYPLATIKQGIAACIAMKKLCFIWGGTGVGKTSVVRQLADDLGARMYGLNLALMEPTDLGGHPHPVKGEDGRVTLDWIQPEVTMPFVRPGKEDELSILFFDEVDRSYPQTQNPAMQLAYERQINGRDLYPSCAVVAAGNGISDSGTTPISQAMATRGVHFYVETSTPKAIESWDTWAAETGVPAWVRGFARYRQNLIVGPEPGFPELQRPTFRTVDLARQLIDFCASVGWGGEVVEPLVFGAVGQVVGRELLAFQKMCDGMPSADEIAKNPGGAALPRDIGVMWAIGRYLIDTAANGGTEHTALTKAFAKYVYRWPEEPAADWMRYASTKLPSLVALPEYSAWERGFARR